MKSTESNIPKVPGGGEDPGRPAQGPAGASRLAEDRP
jgi:hypothetical protein